MKSLEDGIIELLIPLINIPNNQIDKDYNNQIPYEEEDEEEEEKEV